ncbi:MAG: acetyl-CoA carboxylase biotin carboxylase subunit [Sneathiellaceae bacterium]
MPGIRRLLVANRGEIAVRVIRAARSLGIETVLAASAADRDSLGAALADRTVCLGPGPAAQSYLNPGLVVEAARGTGCDALHPGYGFLSEKPALARACAAFGITFVGPPPDTIEQMGDKLAARAMAARAGVPLLPGSAAVADSAAAASIAAEVGYPVLLKAAAGGGGRGMMIADDEPALHAAFETASAEARAAFGDGTLYVERFIRNARHIEVQVLADGHGKVLHLGERDCSVQRRYQKVIEEGPAATLAPGIRAAIQAAAVKLISALDYANAGTVEFLYDAERAAFFFIEVNARIQVEHPVTELITGQDLVAWQLRIAGGEPLDLEQSDIALSGHAIECRINAEDPANGFRPSPGRVQGFAAPEDPAVRFDTYLAEGALVPPFYDSMVGKLLVHGSDRDDAIARMLAALDDLRIDGLSTNQAFHRFVLRHPDFAAGRVHTRWLETVGMDAFLARESAA